MVINIENLGVVRQAKVDLSKKFILFCGRNSTGKTYVSYVLQAFLEQGGVYELDCAKAIVGQIARSGTFKVEKSFITEWLAAKCNSVMSQVGSIFGISDITGKKLFNKFNLGVEYTDEDYNNSLNMDIEAKARNGQHVLRIVRHYKIFCVNGKYGIQV